jgi:nitrogen fixation NifU-like protein
MYREKHNSKHGEVLKEDMKKQSRPAPPPQMSGPLLYYTEAVIDHFNNPRNIGEMAADESNGYALSGDPLCGDQMKLWIRVEKGRIADIKFKSFGCPGAIATSSMVTHLARGRTLERAMALTDDDVIEAAVAAMKKAHPYEEPAYDVVKLEEF